MKKIFTALLINIFLLALTAGAYYGNISESVFDRVRNDSSNSFIKTPKSKIVRVGIGNQSFSTYEHSSADIYGTGEFEIYDNKSYINTYDSENVIKVNITDKVFTLLDSENRVIAKVKGPVIFKTDYGLLGIKGLKRGGKDALYRGQLELVPAVKEGKFHIVNSIELEDYLKGVVPNEMPVHFGLEALKAQSVAARNYVLSPRIKANPNYDVVDSVASQVYFGANTEKELSNRAVEETSGIVATYDWSLILAQYSSTAGGYTENFEYVFSDPKTKAFPSTPKPYLKAKPDYPQTKPLNSEEEAAKFYKSKPKSFDVNSSYFRWEREWNGEELQTEIQNHIAAQSAAGFVKPVVNKGEVIGIIKKLKVLKRGASGKIISMEIETDKGNYVVEKELVIRRLITNHGKALPSANVVFEHEYNNKGQLIYVKAYGGGFGHGVGMSQYGAGYMATELKMSFEEILQHYYTGISLTTEPFILSSNSGQNKVTQTFYTKNRHANLVVDNKYKLGYIEACINNINEKIPLDTTQKTVKYNLTPYLKQGMNTITFYYPAEEKNKGLRMYIELAGENEYNNVRR